MTLGGTEHRLGVDQADAVATGEGLGGVGGLLVGRGARPVRECHSAA